MKRPVHLFGLGVALVLVLGGCGDDGDPADALQDPAEAASARLDAEADTPRATDPGPPDDSSTTTTLGEIDPTTIAGAVINQYSLDLGDCFNRIEELRNGVETTITARVDCEESHRYQVFHELTYPAPHPSVYPGDNVMRDYAIDSCYRHFEQWVGAPYETSALEIDVLTPTRANFEDSAARYRGVHCWVHRVDGEPMVGDARGAGW